MRRPFVLFLALLVLPAPAGGETFRARLRRPARGLQVRMGSFQVPAQGEREVCQAITLPNTAPMDVNELMVAMPGGVDYGSHHFAIFLDNGAGGLDTPTPIDSEGCTNVGGQAVNPILAFVQHTRERIRFPRGVGVRLQPGQRLLLSAHYLNGRPEPLEVDVAINFRAARPRAIAHHLRTFELGTFDIEVPPHSPGSVASTWPVPFPMNLVLVTSHSHKYTRSVVVEVARQDGSSEPQLTTLDYADPAVKRYPRGLRLEAGDGIRWTCNYDNATDRVLRFGLTSIDEMCFALGFFYPDDDVAPLPEVPLCFGGGDGLVCPFN